MFENVCSFPLAADLFAQAIHPSESVIAVGLASGHVQALRLPELDDNAPAAAAAATSKLNGTNGSLSASDERRRSLSSTPSDGQRTVDALWRTRRHKGSCRTLAFDTDGGRLLSAGSDGIVKIASTATGQVEQKLAVPLDRGDTIGAPSLLQVLSRETFVLATDGAAVHVYDSRLSGGSIWGARPAQTHRPHDDYVSSLTPLAPQGGGSVVRQWVTTGGTTLAVTDARRGVLVKSEDQEDELLSSALVRGLDARGSSVGEKLVVGGAAGVLTLWERGAWDDQDERITVDAGARRGGGESLDAIAAVPPHVGTGREVLVGLGDGGVRVVRIGPNKVVGGFRHDDVEGVVALGFDQAGRAISGGGLTLKVWQEWDGAEEEDEEEKEDDDDDDDEEEGGGGGGGGGKRARDGSGSDSDGDDSGGEPAPARSKRKKRRKGRGEGTQARLGTFDGLD